MRVLIVDDNPTNRSLLRSLIDDYSEFESDTPLESVRVNNGLEAVERAASEKFDLILMDIMMPVMDGIEATRKIRSFDRDAVILAISGSNDEASKNEILNSGAAEYISKPVDLNLFFSRLDHYIKLIHAKNMVN